MKIDDMEYWDIPSKASWCFLSHPSPIIALPVSALFKLDLSWHEKLLNGFVKNTDCIYPFPEMNFEKKFVPSAAKCSHISIVLTPIDRCFFSSFSVSFCINHFMENICDWMVFMDCWDDDSKITQLSHSVV